MKKDKLMKIVQAVNDSRGYPRYITNHSFLYIAVSKGKNCFYKGEVHAVNDKATKGCWDFICTIKEFNQCVEEMSVGYGKEENNMNSRKHQHHELIVEWAKDTSKEIEGKFNWVGEWYLLNILDIINDEDGVYECRIKPREFVKGHWYPCVKSGSIQVLMWTGFGFSTTSTSALSHSYQGNYFHNIGESLGKIEFNE